MAPQRRYNVYEDRGRDGRSFIGTVRVYAEEDDDTDDLAREAAKTAYGGPIEVEPAGEVTE